MTTPSHALTHDWEPAGPHRFRAGGHIQLNDETLRDGLQSPSVTDPPAETKVRLLHLMDALSIETACVGLPGAGERQRADAERLCREIAEKKLAIRPNCAGRTLVRDIEPMIDLSQTTGVPVEVCVFIGSSPIRLHTEGWDMARILKHTRDAVTFAVKEGMDVMYVTEDTVRSSPEHLEQLMTAAVEAGAKRLCICDTVGSAIPEGVMNLVGWVGDLIQRLGVDVGIDWHGHRDRGLAMANSLAAAQAGASRLHGAALGVGERVGNTPMEQLLVNLRLLGRRDHDISALPGYAQAVSEALEVPIPANQPVIGRDAFRTATGVHAAAVVKARARGDVGLADAVYSGVPASWLGREQEIEIGPMSGSSNVTHFLEVRGLPHDPEMVQTVLARAKESQRLLPEEDVAAIVQRHTDTAS
jgi:2-isopropylmalate synthase